MKLLENGIYQIDCILKEIEVPTEIKGIVVMAKKKLIERRADRLVLNIAISAASQGMNG